VLGVISKQITAGVCQTLRSIATEFVEQTDGRSEEIANSHDKESRKHARTHAGNSFTGQTSFLPRKI